VSVKNATPTNFHELANLFPLMEGAELEDLRDDIKSQGLKEPIWTFQGSILDGRNRVRACEAAGIPIPTDMIRDFDPAVDGDPLAWVISKNLKRRHLNESQRAFVASKIANMRRGERTDLEPSANLPKVDQPTAAAMFRVSERSVRSAVVLRNQGEPELQHAVEQGHLAVSLAEKAVTLPKAQQRDIAEGAKAGTGNIVRKVIKGNLRKRREEQLAKELKALPVKKYGVILADPEWKFETWSPDGLTNTSADNHYPTSPLDKIKQRDLASISADDAVLFLWATVPMLPQALEVMAAWGFEYVSQCVWIKSKTGTGYWFRNKHEILLVGTRGNVPAPAPGTQWPSAIEAPVGRHSEKPEKFLELIEAYFPTLPKMELNRRGPPREGWSSWGLEAS
jgi:N6-adenosine-specific RNA methylase IME4